MHRLCVILAALMLPSTGLSEHGEPARIDYLTFAQGAIAVAVGPDARARRVGLDKALAAIDGHPGKYSLATKPAGPDSPTEFVYELPALTTFDRFAVTDVLETPSPAQTFIRNIEIHGSTEGPDTGFERLATAVLTAHGERGSVTEIPPLVDMPVRWVRLTLSGGLDVPREQMFQDFSEIIGNGQQAEVPLGDGFEDIWKYRARVLELHQDQATVVGCYDANGELQGTVSGNVLRATGADRVTGVPSLFVLTVTSDGEIRGVRSTNGAPFADYPLPVAPPGITTACSDTAVPALGCGSIVHGINFAFDSADIRPDSAVILAALHEGLRTTPEATIVIEGHTSSEGAEAYNQDLSERRAGAVVEDLMRRGIEAARISPVGRGESAPIATNDDEAGRSLNRRVEVRCD